MPATTSNPRYAMLRYTFTETPVATRLGNVGCSQHHNKRKRVGHDKVKDGYHVQKGNINHDQGESHVNTTRHQTDIEAHFWDDTRWRVGLESDAP